MGPKLETPNPAFVVVGRIAPCTLTGLRCCSSSRILRAFSKGGILSLQWGGEREPC